MRKFSLPILLIAIVAVMMFSCKKFAVEPSGKTDPGNNQKEVITNAAPGNTAYIDSFDAVNHDGDTTETATVLGNKLTNPYLVPNMQQAYANLGITNVSVTVTNKYIRFKPTIDQLSYLDSLMDAKGLELFDAPLDYQILLEGDYYQDPSIPAEQPTWQYAVVPANFSFPSGIQYEVLASIHIPGDSYTAVETEAERLASLGGGGANSLNNGGVGTDGLDCGTGYHYDYTTHTCVANDCASGYHWDGNSCVLDQTSPNPPAPAPDAAVPAGGITVDETQALPGLAISGTQGGYVRAPIRRARIVARRWFKIERTYTDNNGHFQFTKRFKHKVRIEMKCKNDDAIVRSMRGVRLWQMLFPLKKVFGVFSGNKTNIDYNFRKWDITAKARGNRYWAGATVHNAVQEYREFATALNIGQPQNKIRILVTNLAGHGSGSTPMFNKRFLNTLPGEYVTFNIASSLNPIAGGLAALTAVLKHEVDMTISYTGWNNPAYSFFRSDDLKTTTYHELTHAAHYARMKGNWYDQFVNAELAEIITNTGKSSSPYGNGTGSNAPIIALGESWAYYMGHFLADRRYGTTLSTQSNEQGIGYVNNFPVNGLSSHINLLEDFSPLRTADPFHWIPQGVYEDLLDIRNDNAFNASAVIDNVSGYTNQQMFNSFNSGITTLQGYRTNLLNTTTNTTSGSVANLFQQYGY